MVGAEERCSEELGTTWGVVGGGETERGKGERATFPEGLCTSARCYRRVMSMVIARRGCEIGEEEGYAKGLRDNKVVVMDGC